jgi:hypothetical protein
MVVAKGRPKLLIIRSIFIGQRVMHVRPDVILFELLLMLLDSP